MATDGALDTTPHFYTNNVTWNCHHGTATLSTDTYNVHRGVCAYIPAATDIVWLCQAPDPACWTWNHRCSGGETTPGSDQIGCSNRGVSWCCSDAWEVCSGFENQSNACWAKTFANPLFGIDLWSDEATVNAGAVLEKQSLTLGPVPPYPSWTTTSASSAVAGASTELPANISAILEAEHEKIVNEAHANVAIVVTVIGSLIALGLLLNAALWIMRIRHRKKARRRITEVPDIDRTGSRRNLAAPSPTVPLKRDSTSSRISLRERRHSSARTPSFSSDCIADMTSEAIEGARRPRGKDSFISTSPTVVNSPMSETHSINANGPTTKERYMSPMDSPTLPSRKPVLVAKDTNIAEAYDDVPEDPADLGGYAAYERCKRATERARMAKQPTWTEQ